MAILDSVHNYRARDMERILGALLCAAEPAIPTTRSHESSRRVVEAKVPRGDRSPATFSKNGTCVYRGHGTHYPSHRFSPPILGSRLFHAA